LFYNTPCFYHLNAYICKYKHNDIFFIPQQKGHDMETSTIFDTYISDSKVYDEMYNDSIVRSQYKKIMEMLKDIPKEALDLKEEMARQLFMNLGITFTVYSNSEGIERIFPFDIIPRIITAAEWSHVETGIKQRLKALNMFLKDIYNDQEIIKEGIIPAEIINTCPHFLPQVKGVKVPHDIYVHIAGIDLIRDTDGSFFVLEDNLRTPSGVSYMIENREMSKRIFSDILTKNTVHSVSNYPLLLHKILVSLANKRTANPNIVLLTPGVYNSAYYEHSFLARYMGIDLVEGRDLVVQNNRVYSKNTTGLKEIDVIYRRVDDDYLDPHVFNKDSVLGVPGLMSAYASGNVAIVNAVGNGVADDKAIYTYVPDMIKYYLNQTPILKNVPTYQMVNTDEREHVLKNAERMVIKQTNGSGGYGMVIGNSATEKELTDIKAKVIENPRDYIAQPIINLSTSPCYIDGKLSPRRVDLRPYALCGPDGIEIVPGGLTRVALREGSLVVNSSQGGGSKDTWVLS